MSAGQGRALMGARGEQSFKKRIPPIGIRMSRVLTGCTRRARSARNEIDSSRDRLPRAIDHFTGQKGQKLRR